MTPSYHTYIDCCHTHTCSLAAACVCHKLWSIFHCFSSSWRHTYTCDGLLTFMVVYLTQTNHLKNWLFIIFGNDLRAVCWRLNHLDKTILNGQYKSMFLWIEWFFSSVQITCQTDHSIKHTDNELVLFFFFSFQSRTCILWWWRRPSLSSSQPPSRQQQTLSYWAHHHSRSYGCISLLKYKK